MSLHVKAQFCHKGTCRTTGRQLYDLVVEVTMPDGSTEQADFTGITVEDMHANAAFGGTLVERLGGKAAKVNLGPSKKAIRASVTRQERRVAEGLGGHRQTGSGARRGLKGDGRVMGKYRIENKMRTAKSITITLAELRKIRSECEGLEQPVFEIEFRDKHTLRSLDEWVMIPRKIWEKMANDPRNDPGLE